MAAPISFYDFAIKPHIKNLQTAISITKKAQEHCVATSTPELQLINARLYEDMYTFHGQIYQLVKATSQLLQRLPQGGEEGEEADMDGGDGTVTDPPNRDGDNPAITTLQQCVDLLTESLSTLERPGRDSPLFSDSQADRMVRVKYAHMPVFEVTKKQLVEGMVLPNIYFHTTTAYGILRSQGVPLGKGDFLRPFFVDAVDYDFLIKRAQAKYAEEEEERKKKATAQANGN